MKEISISDLTYYIDNEQYLNIRIGNTKIKSKVPLTLETDINQMLKDVLEQNKYKLKENDNDTVFVVSFYAYGDKEYTNSQNKENYLKENKSYLIKNPTEIITKSILKNWSDKKKNNMIDKSDIFQIVIGKPRTCLYTKPMNEMKNGEIVEPKDFIYEDGSTAYENELSVFKLSKNEIKVDYTANWGQKAVTHYYKIDTLNINNVIYVPVEMQKKNKHTEYLLVDGIYSDYQSAKKALLKTQENDKFYTILIRDNIDVIHQEWYKNIFQEEK